MTFRQPVMAAYGGGVNSTALLCGLVGGPPPDAILFADTGGEKPETYDFIATLREYLCRQGFPPIVTVRNEQSGPLEALCLAKGMLPSIAYGRHRRGCSEKAKQRPQHKWARQWKPALDWWAPPNNGLVRKLIGYGAEERFRARINEDRWYEYDYPLISWGWDREACEIAIKNHGLPVPPKSACFFCPASKKPEIIQLGARHPELLERALALERAGRANLQGKGIKGLGGYFSWEEWLGTLDTHPADAITDDNPFGCVCVTPTPDDEDEDGE